jgi:hypothetical protein
MGESSEKLEKQRRLKKFQARRQIDAKISGISLGWRWKLDKSRSIALMSKKEVHEQFEPERVTRLVSFRNVHGAEHFQKSMRVLESISRTQLRRDDRKQR